MVFDGESPAAQPYPGGMRLLAVALLVISGCGDETVINNYGSSSGAQAGPTSGAGGSEDGIGGAGGAPGVTMASASTAEATSTAEAATTAQTSTATTAAGTGGGGGDGQGGAGVGPPPVYFDEDCAPISKGSGACEGGLYPFACAEGMGDKPNETCVLVPFDVGPDQRTWCCEADCFGNGEGECDGIQSIVCHPDGAPSGCSPSSAPGEAFCCEDWEPPT